jgi:hypothetical protein
MTRKCGDCQLCCRLLPVRGIDKKANERCKHQKFGVGCAVYHTPEMPFECGVWNCRWLVNDDTDDLRRPDRSHYVIDIMPDFVEAGGQPMEVIQIWVDPRYPDAHRDPALRAYLARRAFEGKIGLIRYNSKDAFTLIAPALTTAGKWLELPGSSLGRTHSGAEIVNALGGNGMKHTLGDAPISEEYRAKMNDLAHVLDEFFNGDKRGLDRENGFILMVFPFDSLHGGDPRCNYISNANREDIVNLLKEQLARFEGQPQMAGKA